jgi:hypothetical protein
VRVPAVAPPSAAVVPKRESRNFAKTNSRNEFNIRHRPTTEVELGLQALNICENERGESSSLTFAYIDSLNETLLQLEDEVYYTSRRWLASTMSATPNVIVIPSSSPDRIWARSISPCTPERLLGFSPRSSSPPSMLSPSKLFETHSPPHRQNAVAATAETLPLREEVGRENIPIVNNQQENEAGGKAKRASRKAPANQQKKTGETEPVSKDPPSKAAKKTTAATKRVRSQKAKKSEETGNKTLKGRVAKPGNGKVTDSMEKTVTSESIELDSSRDAARKGGVPEHDDLDLGEAVKRRLDWTPPKNTEYRVIDLDEDEPISTKGADSSRGFGGLLLDYRFDEEHHIPSHVQRIGDGHPTKRRRIEVRSLCHCIDRGADLLKLVDHPIFKEVLAVDSAGDALPAQGRVKNPRSQRKKMKTITAHATARYISLDEEEDMTLLQYFEKDEERPADKTAKTSKRKALAKKGKNAVGKSNPPEHIILHPEAATKSLREQELLFGTCSQLEGDDTPTFVRETQRALLESESFATTQNSNLSGGSTTSSSTRSLVSRFASSKSLWSVATRNSDGFVVQPEILNMVDSPDVSGSGPIPHHSKSDKIGDPRGTQKDELVASNTDSNLRSKAPSTFQQKQQQPVPEKQLSVPLEPSEPVNTEVTVAAKEPSLPPPEMPRYNGFTDAELSKKIASYGFKSVKGRKKMIALLERCWQNMHPTAGEGRGNSESCQSSNGPKQSKDIPQAKIPTKSSNKTMDTTESRPKASCSHREDTEGQQEKSDKPKSRGRPLKKKTVSSSLPVSERPQGKKKAALETEKSRAATTATRPPAEAIVVEEIEDSEEELIPSPTRVQQQRQQSLYFSKPDRRRPTTPALSPLPLSLTPSSPSPSRGSTPKKRSPTSNMIHNNDHDDATATAATAADDDVKLSPSLSLLITEAVRAQAASGYNNTTGQKRRPATWQEKILLYDPIVIEEFTTWLNTEGLGLVGEDREIRAGLVRQWCESKGICCCYSKVSRPGRYR